MINKILIKIGTYINIEVNILHYNINYLFLFKLIIDYYTYYIFILTQLLLMYSKIFIQF